MSPRLHRLSNGLAIALQPMSGVETMAVGLYSNVGARSEPDRYSGLAHMVEHMVFKGAAGRNARMIAEAAENCGGQLNAWTARDHTVFQARMLSEYWDLGLELVADLVRSPTLDGEELEREKGVVLSELGESYDTPDDIIHDYLQSVAFKDQALGRPVLGNETSIKAIDRPALSQWVKQYYQPEGFVLAAAGKIDEDAFLKMAESRFSDWGKGQPLAVEKAKFTTGRYDDHRDSDQTHIALGYRGFSYQDIRSHASALLASILGGGMSSRLFQILREEEGLVYSVYSWSQSWIETGIFGIYCAADKKDASKALTLIRQIMADTVESVSEEELQRAKAQARAGLLMNLEGVAARCDHLGRQIQIHNRIVNPSEVVEWIDAVSLDDIRSVGQYSLSQGEALASVGDGLTIS
ncbi:M16 family metallopeptidase [Zymomonas mobilis]|uniref:M16 family metallopeptidase n=1 Tax=Zymomonas mobilis TaxID=542 RepID=UPI0039EBD1C5